MDNRLVENILIEFDKSNSQMNELFRIQNELSTSENDLMALQIRFVHKWTKLYFPFCFLVLFFYKYFIPKKQRERTVKGWIKNKK